MSAIRTSLTRLCALGLAIFALAGCGFKPMYGAPTDAASSAVASALSTVQIRPIADHSGVKLRQFLRERLQPDGPVAAPAYDLEVQLRSTVQELGIRSNATASRANLIVNARFTLIEGGARVFTDEAQAIVSYDILDNQFATESSRENAEDRGIRELGEEIKSRLAVYFDKRFAPKNPA